MKLLPIAGLGFAGLAALIVSTSSPAATEPRRTIVAPNRTIFGISVSTHSKRALRRRPNIAASPCALNASTDANSAIFDGMSDKTNDVEGEVDSGVLAGSYNAVCDGFSGIGAGESNGIGDNGKATLSFIGGGTSNSILGSTSFLGAGTDNIVTGNTAFEGAGFANLASGANSFVGAGGGNEAEGNGSFIGGGDMTFFSQHDQAIAYGNVATAQDSFIGAGDLNGVYGPGSFIGAGGYAYALTGTAQPGNEVQGTDSFLGAGGENEVAGSESFEGAGFQNFVEGDGAFIGSGNYNKVSSGASYAVISGGVRNTASAEYATIEGGYGNAATGLYAVVAGGDGNSAAGTLSFSAGYHAGAAHNGSFVWSDYSSGSAVVKDTAVNQFVVRASGGTYVYSNEAASAGVKLNAGSGSWASLSDRNAKTGIVRVDDASILAKVSALPVDAWQYKTERGVRHVGPMAQDFYAAFGVGEDDRHITSIDEDGVALAAIKALHRENAGLRTDVDHLRAREESKDEELTALRIEVRRLETRVKD